MVLSAVYIIMLWKCLNITGKKHDSSIQSSFLFFSEFQPIAFDAMVAEKITGVVAVYTNYWQNASDNNLSFSKV